MVDEVEQAGVGVVVVLEDQDDGRHQGYPLEEGPPGAEELLGPDARLDADEREQCWFDPASLVGVRDVPRQRLGDLVSGRRFVVGLE